MANPRASAGSRKAGFGVYTTINGTVVMVGRTADGASAGDEFGQSLGSLKGIRTLPIATPDTDKVPISGDDETIVQFEFDSESLEQGVIEAATSDLDFDAIARGTKVYQPTTNISFGAGNPGGAARANLMILGQQRSYDTTDSIFKFAGAILLSNTVTPLKAPLTNREFNAEQYSYTASKSTQYPGGLTFSTARDGKLTDTKVMFNTVNPLAVHVFRGDNSQATFTLPVDPADATNGLWILVDGQIQDLTTHYSISGRTITPATTLATDSFMHVYYEVTEGNLNSAYDV